MSDKDRYLSANGSIAAAMLAGWVLLVALAAILAPEDTLSIGLLVALPVIPVAAHVLMFTVAQAVRGQVFYGMMIALVAVLLVSVTFRHRAYADKSIDAQIVMRLGGIALLLTIGLPHLLRFFSTGMPWAPRLWLSLLLMLVLSSSYAQAPTHALIGSLSFLGGFLLIWHFAEVYGREALIRMMIVSSVIINVLSLIIYFAVPEIGRLHNWINDSWQLTGRMQGVQGAPNGVGLGAGFSILVLLLISQWRRTLWFWAMIALFTVCLLLSQNRMSMVGVVVCGVFVFLCRGEFRLRSALLLSLGLAGGLLFLAFDQIILSMLSRSGSAEEITSLTGRSAIWPAAIEIALESPVIGLGFNSSLQILPLRDDLFTAAAHSHNMFLEILFSSGFVGVGLCAAALAVTIQAAAKAGRHAEIGIIVFFLVYGVTEPVIFGTASHPTLGFFAAMVLAFTGEERIGARASGPVQAMQPQQI